MTSRKKIIKHAWDLIDPKREKDIGPTIEINERAAVIWSGLLGIPIRPDQVAMCLVGYKLAHTTAAYERTKTYEDAIAYLAIAGEMATTQQD